MSDQDYENTIAKLDDEIDQLEAELRERSGLSRREVNDILLENDKLKEYNQNAQSLNGLLEIENAKLKEAMNPKDSLLWMDIAKRLEAQVAALKSRIAKAVSIAEAEPKDKAILVALVEGKQDGK